MLLLPSTAGKFLRRVVVLVARPGAADTPTACGPPSSRAAPKASATRCRASSRSPDAAGMLAHHGFEDAPGRCQGVGVGPALGAQLALAEGCCACGSTPTTPAVLDAQADAAAHAAIGTDARYRVHGAPLRGCPALASSSATRAGGQPGRALYFAARPAAAERGDQLHAGEQTAGLEVEQRPLAGECGGLGAGDVRDSRSARRGTGSPPDAEVSPGRIQCLLADQRLALEHLQLYRWRPRPRAGRRARSAGIAPPWRRRRRAARALSARRAPPSNSGSPNCGPSDQ